MFKLFFILFYLILILFLSLVNYFIYFRQYVLYSTILASQEISTLREITFSPPSQVKTTAACELADTLNIYTCPRHRRIGYALELVFRDQLLSSSCPHLKIIGLALDIVFRDQLLSTWFQALEWERCLKDFLMDDICLALYGHEHNLTIRSDLRNFDYTTVYRHRSITPYILFKFKNFKYGLGPCPYPTPALYFAKIQKL